jgi:U3 small nucleolar RNA-associated protein 7
MHRLAKHIQVEFLEYLPYHYLLASAGGPAGILNYQDITTGQMVAEHRTMDNGRCRVMRQNPSNGLMHLGHAGGVVTFWTPAVGGPVVTMQCHTAPVTAIAIDRAGHYMASASAAGDIRVWDLRTYKALHEYRPVRPAISLDISQRGILAAGHGPHVTMWAEGLAKRSEHPYMQHLQAGNTINCVRFIPYDDILGVGHSGGFDSLIVPGAGEPNYDAFEANPMASRSQRREAEVKQLLNKLPPETIMLDPSSIGTVARTEMERHSLKADLEFGAVNPDGTKRSKRQRATPRKKQLDRAKRRENIIDEEKMRQNEIVINSARPVEAETKTALDRFKLKPL